jgi:plastocyanin
MWLTGFFTIAVLTPLVSQQGETVSVAGRLLVKEAGDKDAPDVDQAVVWLSSDSVFPVRPDTVEMRTVNKDFQPHVIAVPVGSYVSFPNQDPFNHNVFARSEVASFDAGLYGRGERRGHEMLVPGVAQIYCNVHARMGGFVVVRDNPFFTQPKPDGTFEITGVPPGRYVLHAWHERADSTLAQEVLVSRGGVTGLRLTLDATQYKWTEHLDKDGKPYRNRRRRY